MSDPETTEHPIASMLRDFARRDIRHIEPPSDRVQAEMAAADKIDWLCAALRDVRAAITNENGLNDGVIVDCVWVSAIETAVDRIDAALEASGT